VDEIIEIKLIAVTEIEEKITITSLKRKKMLQDGRLGSSGLCILIRSF